MSDDMQNYQIALLDYGMLVMNFFDAISEGDGAQIIRCWKFFLLHLESDGAQSRKYALEALYLLCQVYAILSPRDAHQLVWNRFHKRKYGSGGNIPLDMALGHCNNFLKSILHHVGPNSTNKRAIDRYCKALTFNKKILENFERTNDILKISGKHVRGPTEEDLKKLVKQLLSEDAFKFVKGREYKFFQGVKRNLLQDLNLHAKYTWINEHERNIFKSKLAR